MAGATRLNAALKVLIEREGESARGARRVLRDYLGVNESQARQLWNLFQGLGYLVESRGPYQLLKKEEVTEEMLDQLFSGKDRH